MDRFSKKITFVDRLIGVFGERKAICDLKAFVDNKSQEGALGHINGTGTFLVTMLDHFHHRLQKITVSIDHKEN